MDVYMDYGCENFSLSDVLFEDDCLLFDTGLGSPSVFDTSSVSPSSPGTLGGVLWGGSALDDLVSSSATPGSEPDPLIMVNPSSIMPVVNREQAVLRKEDTKSLLSKTLSNPHVVNAIIKEEPEEDCLDQMDHGEESEEEEELLPPSKIKTEPFVNEVKTESAHARALWNSLVSKPNERRIVKPQETLLRVKSTQFTQKSSVHSHSPSTHLSERREKANPKYLTEAFPKPAYSYSCLIAMALKNSPSGSLPVSEIYNFMCEHFPYFKSAPPGWKNSVRHNLSLNKCFEKIEKGTTVTGNGSGSQRKGCLWALNPTKERKMADEVAKWSKKDPLAIKRAMKNPENLERLERGEIRTGFKNLENLENGDEAIEEESEEDLEERELEHSSSEPEADSGSDDEGEVPPSLKPFDQRLNLRKANELLSSHLSNDLGAEISDDMYEELVVLQQVLGEGEGSNTVYRNGKTTFNGRSAGQPVNKRPRLRCVVSPFQLQPISSRQ